MTSKLRVAPVGTCRIHTPLRSGTSRHQIATELGRNYGFVQTTAEALQQLRFMIDGAPVPNDISRVVYRPTVPEGFLKSTHTRADVYLVEISSRKLVTVEDRPVQINYLQRYFNDFFMDRERSRWFWHLSTPEQVKERADLLRKERTFQRLNAADKKLLAAVVRRDQTDEEVEREILEIADYVGRDRIIFITHVDALTPDNTLLDHRHRMIQLMRTICRKLDLPCYDPTPLMREIGQMNAMENLGLDLTHYTDAFSARLCDDWNRRLFAPRLNTLDENSVTAPEGQDIDGVGELEAMWNRAARASRVARPDPVRFRRL